MTQQLPEDIDYKVGDIIQTVKRPENLSGYPWAALGKVWTVVDVVPGCAVFFGKPRYLYSFRSAQWRMVKASSLSKILWAKEIEKNV